jgi:hypothetical protein
VRGMPALWVTSVLTLFVFAYEAKIFYSARKPMQVAAQAVSAAKLAQAKVEQVTETQTATPEDPGEVSVMGPLAVWMREANPLQTEPARVWSGPLQPMDHVSAAAPLADKYLRANFPLKKSAQFTFVIPPHTVSPRLHGSFQSSIRHSGSDNAKDAGIELILLNAEQFDDFIHGRPGDSTFELQSSSHTVDFLLPAAHDKPQEYHLVFRDPAARAKLFVKADFAVNAE